MSGHVYEVPVASQGNEPLYHVREMSGHVYEGLATGTSYS
jgi:hypothetical protein